MRSTKILISVITIIIIIVLLSACKGIEIMANQDAWDLLSGSDLCSQVTEISTGATPCAKSCGSPRRAPADRDI